MEIEIEADVQDSNEQTKGAHISESVRVSLQILSPIMNLMIVNARCD
jgi:hypothetical protein